jgi:hypothetical protein
MIPSTGVKTASLWRLAFAHGLRAAMVGAAVFSAGGPVVVMVMGRVDTPNHHSASTAAVNRERRLMTLHAGANHRHDTNAGADRPGMFALLTAVELTRSCISFGVNTFVALYWINHLGASRGLGGAALTLELAGGFFGTLIGGRISDRFGPTRTVQLGNCLLIPAFAALLLCNNKSAALPLIAIVGLITNIPFAVLIKLGQEYLPSRPGTAAGVTLGLAVRAGGLFQPVLGLASLLMHRLDAAKSVPE